MKIANFDYIIIETVGVGQSEIEIAGLADFTIVVLVPEAGDEIQTMKAGLMEIADLFVINKADRPDANAFVNNLKMMLAPAFHHKKQEIKIVKTVATKKEGIEELISCFSFLISENINDEQLEKRNKRHSYLLTEKAFQIIQQNRMKNVNKNLLKSEIEIASKDKNFNLYQFITKYEISGMYNDDASQ